MILRASIATLWVVLATTMTLGASDLNSLVREYNEAKSRASRKGKRRRGLTTGKRSSKSPEQVLDEIGKLASDEALQFLTVEVEKAAENLAMRATESILKSGHARAHNIAFALLSSKSTRTAKIVLDVVSPEPSSPKYGLDTFQFEWVSLKQELLSAAKRLKPSSLRARLMPLVAKLGLDGAKAILKYAPKKAAKNASDLQLHFVSVRELISVGSEAEVTRWLADEGHEFAKSNPGALSILAETAGALEIRSLAPGLGRHLKEKGAVFVSVVEALSRLSKEIP
ncbi:MAG: hypothetical protein AAF517_22140, partial [Planctomycetota bacterium]